MTYIMPHMKKTMDRKVLKIVEPQKEFILQNHDGGRMGSTVIIFHSEGIIITGDLHPRRRGVISDFGYDLSWFAREQSEGYLCSKFLTKVWQNEVAHVDVQNIIKDLKAEDEEWDEPSYKKAIKRWQSLLDDWDDIWTDTHVYERASTIDCEAYDYHIGWDYDLADAGWLAATQQAFVRLYSQVVQ